MLVLVIHMAAYAGLAGAAALSTAGAPAFKPVTRARTTCRPSSSPLATSTTPARSSLSPSFTARLAILPPSIVNTYDCPASSRTALDGITAERAVLSTTMSLGEHPALQRAVLVLDRDLQRDRARS